MSNGKEGWKTCIAYLREPTFINPTDDQDHGYGDLYAGFPQSAANRSIVVMVSNEADNVMFRTFPYEENGFGIRDAFTLNYIRTVSCPIPHSRVTICGRVGSEIIVTSNFSQICACRGDDTQMWQHFPVNFEHGRGIPILGCETHLIAFDRTIGIYSVNNGQSGSTGGGLVSLCQTIRVDQNKRPIAVSWNSDKSHFIACFPHEIGVWKFDTESSNATLIQTIITQKAISNAALAKDYIVGTSDNKKLDIWHRISGELLYSNLCDVGEDDELDEDEANYPITMSCHGNLLISTSHIGCALCVWNLKTGQLLKRYTHAEDEGDADMLPDGADVSCMVYLERLNGFSCITMSMKIWAFPTNQRQDEMARSILRREGRITRALYEYDL